MSEPSNHGRAGKNALVIEDVRLAEIEFVRHGYECTRITHDEAIGTAGDTNARKLLKGDLMCYGYQLQVTGVCKHEKPVH